MSGSTTQVPRCVGAAAVLRDGAAGDTRFATVALSTHHWGPERHQSGVVAYASNMMDGMRRLGAAAYVIANQVGAEGGSCEACKDDHVRLVPPWAEVRGRGWQRLAAAAGRRVCADYAAVWMMSRRLLRVLNDLYCTRGLELFETEESCGVAGIVAPRCPVPVVLRLHGPWFLVGPAAGVARNHDYERRVRREGRAMTRVAAVSAPSRDVLERTASFYGERFALATVIPNPVRTVPEASRWSLERCEHGRLLFVGRFDHAKGADLMLEAFCRVASVLPDATLTMAGADAGNMDWHGARLEAREYIDHALPDPSIRGRVEWLGVCSPSELAELRRRAHVCVTASRYESFSMVTLESMAAGCPVVAPDVGGIPELLQDGRNGLLYRVGNPEQLAARVLQVCRNPALAETIGRCAGVDASRDFNPVSIARRTLEFHREVIARARR